MHHPAQETHGEPTLRLPEPSSELQPLLWHCPTNESHCFSTRELQLCLLSPTRPVHRGASSWHGSRQVLQGEGVRGDPRRSWFSSFKDPGLALPLFDARELLLHMLLSSCIVTTGWRASTVPVTLSGLRVGHLSFFQGVFNKIAK